MVHLFGEDVTDLRRALARGDFRLRYQPIVSLTRGPPSPSSTWRSRLLANV